MRGVNVEWRGSGFMWGVEVGHITDGTKQVLAVCVELESTEDMRSEVLDLEGSVGAAAGAGVASAGVASAGVASSAT